MDCFHLPQEQMSTLWIWKIVSQHEEHDADFTIGIRTSNAVLGSKHLGRLETSLRKSVE